MFELTFTVANATNADVFRVFEQDMSVVIDVINYLTMRAEDNDADDPAPQQMNTETKKKDIFWDYV